MCFLPVDPAESAAVIAHDVLRVAVPVLEGDRHGNIESLPGIVVKPGESLVSKLLFAAVAPSACGLRDCTVVKSGVWRKTVRRHGFGGGMHRAKVAGQVTPLCVTQLARWRKWAVCPCGKTDDAVARRTCDEVGYNTLQTLRSMGDQHHLSPCSGQSIRIRRHLEDELLVGVPKPNDQRSGAPLGQSDQRKGRFQTKIPARPSDESFLGRGQLVGLSQWCGHARILPRGADTGPAWSIHTAEPPPPGGPSGSDYMQTRVAASDDYG